MKKKEFIGNLIYWEFDTKLLSRLFSLQDQLRWWYILYLSEVLPVLHGDLYFICEMLPKLNPYFSWMKFQSTFFASQARCYSYSLTVHCVTACFEIVWTNANYSTLYRCLVLDARSRYLYIYWQRFNMYLLCFCVKLWPDLYKYMLEMFCILTFNILECDAFLHP